MKKPLAGLLALLALLSAGCQQPAAQAHPTPSPRAVVRCAKGDAVEYDQVLGWAFCIPDTWRSLGGERTQKTALGVDALFDITEYAPGPTNGFFGVIIISTDQRGSAANLGDWVAKNLGSGVQTQPMQWGNAIEAASQVGTEYPTYLALTPHNVVILELHSGPGNLDLQSAMSARFATWKFTY